MKLTQMLVIATILLLSASLMLAQSPVPFGVEVPLGAVTIMVNTTSNNPMPSVINYPVPTKYGVMVGVAKTERTAKADSFRVLVRAKNTAGAVVTANIRIGVTSTWLPWYWGFASAFSDSPLTELISVTVTEIAPIATYDTGTP